MAAPALRRRRAFDPPKPTYKFWFKLNAYAWSPYELIPCRSSFPPVISDIFVWMHRVGMEPMSIEMVNADLIGFWFTDLAAATMFRLKWHQECTEMQVSCD